MFKPALKTHVRRLSKSYYVAQFSLLEKVRLNPRPLQFVNIWVPGVDEIPMSISDYDESSGEVSILFKVVGEGTRRIRDGRGFYGLKGPLGRGFTINADRILFIAGGTGIAPLPFLAKEADKLGVKVDVLWGVRSSEDLFNVKAVAPAVNNVIVTTEDCKIGLCGTVSDVLKKLSIAGNYDVVVSVGPKPMLRGVCKQLEGITEVFVSLEALVKCGLGACGSCTLTPTKLLLCIDGPVFKCEEVAEHLDRP